MRKKRNGRDGFVMPLMAIAIPVILAAVALCADLGQIVLVRHKAETLCRAASLRAARADLDGLDMSVAAAAGFPAGVAVSAWPDGDAVVVETVWPPVPPTFSKLFGASPFIPKASHSIRQYPARSSKGMTGLMLPAKMEWDDLSSPVPADRNNGFIDESEWPTLSTAPWTQADIGTRVSLTPKAGFNQSALLQVADSGGVAGNDTYAVGDLLSPAPSPVPVLDTAAKVVALDPGAWWDGQTVAGSVYPAGESPRLLRVPVVAPVSGGFSVVGLAGLFVESGDSGIAGVVVSMVSLDGKPGGTGTVFALIPVR